MKLLFVTGRLAEPALRGLLHDLAPRLGFEAEVAVLPISVAALMTTAWVARHLSVLGDVTRIILPGNCRGDLSAIAEKAGVPVERGPEDLRDLPRHLGGEPSRLGAFGPYNIEILAETNHAPHLSMPDLLALAMRYRAEGADLIDLGCVPGERWRGVGGAVRAMRDQGLRVSIDSFDPDEVTDAVAAGAELVLSVNATNRQRAVDWGVEVVVIPDEGRSLDGLAETVEYLTANNVRFRLDPVLDPIGFGFAESLGRYLELRRLYPRTPVMMGVGNITELTDVDSAGVNTLLIGFCQELGILSVLTTEVINWARSSIKEIDLARRLMYHAVTRSTLPKHVEPRLVTLRDTRLVRFGPEALAEIASRVKDPNWRIFAEDGKLVAINGSAFLTEEDPFVLFEKMGVGDPSHAFYLGYELMKARISITLSKNYRQDRALEWGFLTEPEVSHASRKAKKAKG